MSSWKRDPPFTPEASFLEPTEDAHNPCPVAPGLLSPGNQQPNAASTGKAGFILPSISDIDSTKNMTVLQHKKSELLGYFKTELDVRKVNTMKNHLWLAGQRRSCRPLHMQKMLGRGIVVVEICHLHLTWRDSTIFIKPCPDFLLDHSTWQTYLCTEEELYRNALGFLRTYVSLVRRKSDLKIAHELGLLSDKLNWAQWTRLSRLVVEKDFDASIIGDSKAGGVERIVRDRWCYGELRLGRLNWIYRLCFCAPKREPGQLQRGFFNQYQNYRSFLEQNITWLTVSTIYVALVLTAMQVGLGTQRLNNSSRFTNAAVGFTIFSIVAPLSVIALIAAIMLYKFADNALYTLNRLGTHRAPLKGHV